MIQAKNVVTTLNLNRYLPFYLTTITYQLARNASRVFPGRFGVNQIEWTILAIVATNPKISAMQVSQIVSLDKAAISRGVRSLQDKGLLAGSPVKEHNRRRELSITAQGWEVYEQLRIFVLERERKLLKNLTGEEVETLLRLVRKVHENTQDAADFEVPKRSR